MSFGMALIMTMILTNHCPFYRRPARTSFLLINPILWLVTLSFFLFYPIVGPAIESLYPAPVFYMAVFSLIFGNFLAVYNYMIGCARRGHWAVVKYVYLVPFYWVLASVAAGLAAFQLVVKPHFWEKTIHGFHLGNAPKRFRVTEFVGMGIDRFGWEKIGGVLLILSSLAGNFFNFLYNAYLGRNVSFEEFGLISLIGSFIYLISVLTSSLGHTITHRTAFLFGKHGQALKGFWVHSRRNAVLLAIFLTAVWVSLTPVWQKIFNSIDPLPFLLFSPVILIDVIGSVDSGFLRGNLKFTSIAYLVVIEAASKFVLTILFVSLGLNRWVYSAIPLSMLISFVFTYLAVMRLPEKPLVSSIDRSIFNFPKKFFGSAFVYKLSGIAFVGFDLILAKHYLSPLAAGQYGLLSLVGKMVFFMGGLIGQFVMPIVSRDEGAGKNSRVAFDKILGVIILFSGASFIGLGVFGHLTTPLLWGPKALAIVEFLPVYTLAMVYLSVASAIVLFHQAKKEYLFPIGSCVLAAVQILGIVVFHETVSQIVMVTFYSAMGTLVIALFFHNFSGITADLFRAITDFLGLFYQLPVPALPAEGKLRILVFNWRDLRHRWAGGAEVYVHELARRWVSMGHEVTVFCGSDGKSPRHDLLDGVNIIRRGGFYFYFFWAILYYLLRFRGKYDVIIDCENGLPFFTPMFAWDVKNKFLLIHHVHQEIFRVGLRPPFSWLAMFLERKVMPLVYRNTNVITVSPSSKADILDYHFTNKEPEIIYNGVDLTVCKPGEKSKNPLILYLGRLKDIKSLPVFIQAAKLVLEKIPKAEFVIAGDGPDRKRLELLVGGLGLKEKITFTGKVSEEEKISLYQKAWVFVNPSLMEGWGITTIEANACGTPVVASNVAGLRDSVYNPHSGFLVPYGQPAEFAEKIILIVNNGRLRGRMSREALAWAKKFDWEKSANDAIGIFNAYEKKY
jgi:glycosyltransferase involved in cell wall biosynthesis/O-antigen/teichoic acid export membrane protein